MLQRKPGLSPGTVCSILMATAKHLGPRGRDSLSGTGLADAYGTLPAEKARLAAGRPIERARPGGIEANCQNVIARRGTLQRVARSSLVGRQLSRRPIMAEASFEPERLAQTTRRDFLFIATAVVGAAGAAAAIVPLIDQMNPDAATLAAGRPVDLDLSRVAPGQQVQVRWRSRPVFVVNRTPAALERLQSSAVVARLADPQSQARQQPPYAQNWHRSIKPEYGVLVGICTHLGCIPGFFPEVSATTPSADWPGGYFCPCHGSKYDLAGRVYSGVPAPYNLPVPPYRFISGGKIRIGENPPGETFDFGSIREV